MAYVNREYLLNKIAERKEALVSAYGSVYEAPSVRVQEWNLWDEMEEYIYQADTLFTESEIHIKAIKPRNVEWSYNTHKGICKCGSIVYTGEIYCDRCGSKLDWSEVKE